MHIPNSYYRPDAFSPFYSQYPPFSSQIMHPYAYQRQLYANSYNMISSTHPAWPPNSCFPYGSPHSPHYDPCQVTYPLYKNTTPVLKIQESSEHQHPESPRSSTPQRREGGQGIVKEEENESQSEERSRLVLRPRKEKRKQKHHKRSRRINASYYWSVDQNQRYYDFLQTNSRLFELSLSEKKNLRINVLMSKKVKTRSSQQCHSHHQKMMKKYGSIETLLIEMNAYLQKRDRRQFQSQKVGQEDPYESQFKI